MNELSASSRSAVLLVSTSYPKNEKEWQGRFIADMVESLANRNDIELNVWAPPGRLPANSSSAATADESAWLAEMLARGGIAHLLRKQKLAGIAYAMGLLLRLRRLYRAKPLPEVAHVNWLQNALPLWGTSTPALITILGSDFALLKLPGMVPLLRTMMRQRQCMLAPNAAWMAAPLQKHFGDIAEIRTIPFGVDKKWYSLQRHAPQQTAKRWLAVTRLTQAKLGNLLDWGEAFFTQDRELHLFGPMQEEISLPAWVRYHGPTNPAELQSTWFPQAAGLITLSRHDEGRPQVMLEAMASGLPIIASDLPAHKDLLRHRVTGWIADSPASLGQALDFLDASENNVRMGEAAKAWIRQEVGDWDDCAGRYRCAYADLQQSSKRLHG
jgi:glycosyltransferase involved in cell wall biosynthesis